MKPFNLERALSGDPVVTRDGRKVAQIVAFKNILENYQSVVAVVDGIIHRYMSNGRFFKTNETLVDLFMAEEEKAEGKWWTCFSEISEQDTVFLRYDSFKEKIQARDTHYTELFTDLCGRLLEIERRLDAHTEVINQKHSFPHKCPCCDGKGRNQIFPNLCGPFETGIIYSQGGHFKSCNSCQGKGVLWG